MPTRGDIVIANSVPAWAALPIGAAGSLLVSDGVDPAWSLDRRNSMFRAGLSTNQTGVTDATWVKVNLDTDSSAGLLWDIGGNFDTTNKRYILPVTGYYSINHTLIFSTGSTNKIRRVNTMIEYDGAYHSQGNQVRFDLNNCEDYLICCGSDILYGVAGHYFELFGYLDVDSGTGIFASQAGANYCGSFMSGMLVST
jgi:hypothetical protein